MEDAHAALSGDGWAAFAAFDGHGSAEAADHCAKRLLPSLAARLVGSGKAGEEPPPPGAVGRALRAAFAAADAELAAAGAARLCGTTAVAAVVTRAHILAANCGDSRAVLVRGGGRAVELTSDHSPARRDERVRFVLFVFFFGCCCRHTLAHASGSVHVWIVVPTSSPPSLSPATQQERVRRAGGHVVSRNGVDRVMGVLSMTRALGDHFLRRHGVIAEPELSAIARAASDELLIVATDGLWAAVSSAEAAAVARSALARAEASGLPRAAAAAVAPRALARLAQARGSTDNVTVLVADLRAAPGSGTPCAAAGGCAAAAAAAAAVTEAATAAPAAPRAPPSPFGAAGLQLPRLNLAPIRTRERSGAGAGAMPDGAQRRHSDSAGARVPPLPLASAAAAAAIDFGAGDACAALEMLRARSAPALRFTAVVTTGGPVLPAAPPQGAPRSCALEAHAATAEAAPARRAVAVAAGASSGALR